MIEYPRLGLVLLFVAVANLATDVTRLLVEWSHPIAPHEQIPIEAHPGDHDMPRQAADASRPEPAQEKVATLVIPDARGPPRAPRAGGAARAPFSPLPPDFSIDQPPWCPACRTQSMRRYVERRRFRDW